MEIFPFLMELVRINKYARLNMKRNELEWLTELRFKNKEPTANDYWLLLLKYREIK